MDIDIYIIGLIKKLNSSLKVSEDERLLNINIEENRLE